MCILFHVILLKFSILRDCETTCRFKPHSKAGIQSIQTTSLGFLYYIVLSKSGSIGNLYVLYKLITLKCCIACYNSVIQKTDCNVGNRKNYVEDSESIFICDKRHRCIRNQFLTSLSEFFKGSMISHEIEMFSFYNPKHSLNHCGRFLAPLEEWEKVSILPQSCNLEVGQNCKKKNKFLLN